MKTDMKRILLALAATLALLPAANAQKPLTFNKVEIKGTTDEMVAALGKKGFKYEETNDGVPLVIGKFAGYSDVEVTVISCTVDHGCLHQFTGDGVYNVCS